MRKLHPNHEFIAVAVLTIVTLAGSFAYLTSASPSLAIQIPLTMSKQKPLNRLPAISVTPSFLPIQPMIVMAGKASDTPMSSYDIAAGANDVTISSLNLQSFGYGAARFVPADISEASVFINNVKVAFTTNTPTSTATPTITFTPPRQIPKNTKITLTIQARFPSVQAQSTCGTTPVTTPCVLSGDGVQMKITKVNGSALNKVFSIAPSSNKTAPRILRNSVPFFNKLSLANTTLINADIELHRMLVSADSSGPIGLKSITYMINTSASTSISYIRMRRGCCDLPSTDYQLYLNGKLLPSTGAEPVIPPGSKSARLTVVMSPGYEESVSGNGNIYIIHGVVAGAKPGEFIATSHYSSQAQGSFSNCLSQDTSGEPMLTAISGQANAHLYGTIWSDYSEVPHSASTCTNSGSKDWINDGFLQIYPFIQTLTY